MNNKTPVLLTVLSLALLTGLAIAATHPASPPVSGPAPDGPAAGFRARIAEKLGLSPDQQRAIEDLRARQKAEVLALLTPEQQQKAGEMRGEMKERFHRFAQGHPAGSRVDRRGPGMPPAHPLALVAMSERIKDRLAEKLQLSDEQRDQLEHLGRAYRAQQRDATKKHFEEMRAVLTPGQQQKFQELKQSRAGPEGGQPPLAVMSDALEEDMAGDFPPPPEES